MTAFRNALIYTLEQDKNKDGTDKGAPYVKAFPGYTFQTFDAEMAVPINVGIYKRNKIYVVSCLDTGRMICSAHRRDESRQSVVDKFERLYKSEYMRFLHERFNGERDNSYSVAKEQFDNAFKEYVEMTI